MNYREQKIIVKIRKEHNYYFAYFIELRRLIPVNYIGTKIIDAFFNKNYNLDEIVKSINSKRKTVNKKDVSDFLHNIKKEITLPYEGGYPIIGKEQLDAPIAVELQTNTTCNLRCKHCCQAGYNKIMPINRVKDILEILYKNNIFEIN